MNAPAQENFSFDRRAVMRAFDRAAPDYDAGALLQQQVRAELLERLGYFSLLPQTVLDLGAGTCRGAIALRRRYPRARVIAIDIAPGMLRAAPRALWPWRGFDRLCADAHTLPLADGSVELIFSNLMLQWCAQPEPVFRELARVLKPGGVLLFSSFGPETLHELRAAWSSVDDGMHVTPFADLPQLGDALMHAGLREPVLDLEQHRLRYPDVYALMRALKHIGAGNAASGRARGLTGRARMQRMVDAYRPGRSATGVPATFEVIFGAAFGNAQRADAFEPSAPPGEFSVPVSDIRRTPR
ncbi:MAG TPA: malonyl-ACP O-methyltransferase BioC [Steroidobacteraceae bacterium]|jgi:malonyl-CoA O-methyltransferase